MEPSSFDPELIRSPIDTPNQNFFTGNSILKNKDGLLAAQYIQGHCPYPDRVALDKLSSPDLVKTFCMDRTRGHVKVSSLIIQTRIGFIDPTLVRELETLKKENKRLKVREAKFLNSVREHKDKLLGLERSISNSESKIKELGKENANLKAELKDTQVQAREEGIEIGRRDFLKSKEGVMQQYEFTFDQAELQLQAMGIQEPLDRDGSPALLKDLEGFVFSKVANEINLTSDETFISALNDQTLLADLQAAVSQAAAE
ncbi:hypothetical protein DH2020_039443 [Rehmannia glutinosa]|uniref:Uncharacterized protein n=1 Tax=Rehmannia glutinosa TaxID=99300 RepID=A0ABR0UW10_REHGL